LRSNSGRGQAALSDPSPKNSRYTQIFRCRYAGATCTSRGGLLVNNFQSDLGSVRQTIYLFCQIPRSKKKFGNIYRPEIYAIVLTAEDCGYFQTVTTARSRITKQDFRFLNEKFHFPIQNECRIVANLDHPGF